MRSTSGICFRIHIDKSIGSPTYAEIFVNKLWKNQPFLLVGNPCVDISGQPWKAKTSWVTAGGTSLNMSTLIAEYGVYNVMHCLLMRKSDGMRRSV